jgi:hypothetical protein
MTTSERGISPENEPQSTGVEMAWVNLTPKLTATMRAGSLEQKIDVYPVEGIAIWGETPEQREMRELLTELGQRRVMDRNEVEPVKLVILPHGATRGTKVRSLFPLATIFDNADRTVGSKYQKGRLLVLAKESAATPLQYEKALSSLLMETNKMLTSIGRPPFPAYTNPTTRKSIDSVSKK